ncbi:rRNA maturation RNase YbeY [Sediminicurvatus halobius]|uniref:Endoribonuclease YbeY n=1 Tax=Sediminicurvatus halobius TaxID=2182432 RepID=A0A2U2N4R1_9GAMM|nr:rRNA maturation RNase YbeY [Spiribacter halobius]PWG64110.1 rRNA maturation RNase YbeY [Spiribacter halobius]UEX78772.1 rRNA maturation RNase YbeY [Spiribacter halobius]
MSNVTMQIASEHGSIPGAADFRRWAAAALGEAHAEAEMTIRVVDEAEGRALNRDYRGRDYATNVLSFPVELPAGVELPLVGDLVICAPVVTREAAEQGKAPEAHWAHLVVHGVLHLLGYDHIREDEGVVMEAREREILAGLGYPDPYA